jgi:hypothetical protein
MGTPTCLLPEHPWAGLVCVKSSYNHVYMISDASGEPGLFRQWSGPRMGMCISLSFDGVSDGIQTAA